MEIKDVKLYLKIDEDEDDPIITMQMKAAQSYLRKAGVKTDQLNEESEDYDLYRLAICMIVGHWYENRNAVVIGSISREIEHSLTSIIIQLRN